MSLADRLRGMGACSKAVEWAEPYGDDHARAWAECECGDWMLWLLGRLSGEPGSDARRRLVLAACACARLVLHLVPDGEDRPRVAIETAERWARGENGVSLDDVRRAAYDFYASSSAAAPAAFYASASAFYSSVDAVSDCAAAAAREPTLSRCADIVREHYPEPPVLEVSA